MDIVLTYEKKFIEGVGFDIANLDLYLYDSDGYLITSSTSTKNNLEVLINIPPQYGHMILEVRQTETVPNDNTVGEEDLAVFYSISWKMH